MNESINQVKSLSNLMVTCTNLCISVYLYMCTRVCMCTYHVCYCTFMFIHFSMISSFKKCTLKWTLDYILTVLSEHFDTSAPHVP